MSAEEILDKIMHGEVVTVEGHTLLTGTQWYDRFIQEWQKLEGTNYKYSDILEAAKRASGIEK